MIYIYTSALKFRYNYEREKVQRLQINRAMLKDHISIRLNFHGRENNDFN